jgi:murein DD-endopeptidase MepM/ murein hydrolase activator NlpD
MRLLLLVLEKKSYSGITNHFSYKTIKKRIKMITANKTTTNRKLSYLLLLPALFIIVQAFSLHPDAKENKPSISPIDMKNVEKISLAWGVKFQDPITKHERVHEGIDMAAPEGTKVVASADGIVSFAEFSEKGWGKLVVIRHSESYETWYAHLYSITVKNGERVSKGQQLGSVGSTGKSTGPHLHYEVRKDTKRVNPIDYFDEK